MVDIAEQICLAVDQIVSQRLKSINYDTTITATIVDNTDSQQNKYICSNGTAQFVAYSKDTTFKIGDSVQVTIPNNDYDQQKIIIGRYVNGESIPYNFIRPFDTIIDTSSNLINENVLINSLLANDPDIEQITIWSKIFKDGLFSFNRLGMQGQFRSWISSFKPIDGSYGYKLEIVSTKEEQVSKNYVTPELIEIYTNIISKITYQYENVLNNIGEEWYNKTKDTLNINPSDEKTIKESFIQSFNIEYNNNKFSNKCKNMIYALLYSNVQIVELFLDSSDMYGNPYNFQNFFEQEKVFDISSLGTIFGMSLFFYQKKESFLKENGEQVPYQDELKTGKLLPNLFTKDPYICLGYDLSDFDKEQAILYTISKPNYIIKDGIDKEVNKKILELRWLHQQEDGQIKVINSNSKIGDYEIRWYRFKLGVPSADEYSGVYWNSIKVLQQNETIGDESAYVMSENPFACVLYPAIERQEEQVKAIILYNGQIIQSNIIKFENEQVVINSSTIELLNGLQIWCLDGSYGNYYRYGQDNQLMDSTDTLSDKDGNNTGASITANTIFSLEARFADNTLLQKEYDIDKVAPILTEAKAITWEFPLNYSMLVVQDFDYSTNTYNGQCSNYSINNGILKIVREGNENYQIDAHQDYRILKTFDASKTNNTIKCTVYKNGLVYNAVKEFSFGLMGTNGTDATVVIDFDNNITALTANKQESVKLTAHLYDSSHREVDFNNIDLNLSCTWEWLYPKDNYANTIIKIASTNKNVCNVEHNIFTMSDSNVRHFCILKVTIKGYGDYDLITYKALPIRKNNTIKNVLAPTEVIYGTAGYPTYYKEPCRLYKTNDPNNDNNYEGQLENIVEALDVNWSIYNPFNEVDFALGSITDKKVLKPAAIYTKEVDFYGIKCYNNTEGILWLQPLIIIQNQYPSSTLNKWNGKEIEINNDNGTIVAPAIAAGKKNSDNTFSGVMLGDWKDKDSESGGTSSDITQQTGIYGFNHGAMSFAFKEDGTAFIGKSGRGRINFDGNKGTIQSGIYEKNNHGMQIDLDGDGEDTKNSPSAALRAYGLGGAFELNTAGGDSTPLLVIRDGPASNSKKLFYIGGKEGSNREFYLQSANYVKNSDGTKIDLASGKIEIYNGNGSGTSASWIKIDGDGDPYLEIHDGINNINIFHASIEKFYLQSSNYQHNVDGTKIDLNNGRIEIYNKGDNTSSYIRIDGSGSPYFQIYDGTKNIFYATKTTYYLQSANYQSGVDGTKLDLNKGRLEFYNKGDNGSSFIRIDGSGSPYFQINNGEKNIFYASDNGYYLQSANYQSGVDGTKLDLDDGRLYMYSAEDGTSITIRGDGSPFLKIEDNGTNIFYASKGQYYLQSKDYVSGVSGIRIDLDDGSIDARYGYIGGWKIGQYTLTGGSGDSIIELNAQYGYLLGGELRSITGEIFLNGYFTVGSRGSDMRFGYYSSNTGTEADLTSQGIGMSVEGFSKVITTSNNVGLAFINGGHISIDSSKLTINHNTKIIFGNSGASLECEIPPENQYGIYARFA